jgi:hypothetical protein
MPADNENPVGRLLLAADGPDIDPQGEAPRPQASPPTLLLTCSDKGEYAMTGLTGSWKAAPEGIRHKVPDSAALSACRFRKPAGGWISRT